MPKNDGRSTGDLYYDDSNHVHVSHIVLDRTK